MYLFTGSALEGTAPDGRGFRLPWADVEAVAVESSRPRSLWARIFFRRYVNDVSAYLLITIRPGADLTGPMAAWSRRNPVRVPFWNRPELTDSFAYGCRTFAGEKFQGVILR